MSEELRPCPYCGGKVRGDKDVWCDCRMFAPRDRHQNAYCWKLLEESEKRVQAYRQVAIESGCTMCNGAEYNESRPVDVDAEAERILKEGA